MQPLSKGEGDQETARPERQGPTGRSGTSNLPAKSTQGERPWYQLVVSTARVKSLSPASRKVAGRGLALAAGW